MSVPSLHRQSTDCLIGWHCRIELFNYSMGVTDVGRLLDFGMSLVSVDCGKYKLVKFQLRWIKSFSNTFNCCHSTSHEHWCVHYFQIIFPFCNYSHAFSASDKSSYHTPSSKSVIMSHLQRDGLHYRSSTQFSMSLLHWVNTHLMFGVSQVSAWATCVSSYATLVLVRIRWWIP